MEPKSYHRDLADKKWEITMAYLRQHQGLGRPLKWELNEIINAILSVVTNGERIKGDFWFIQQFIQRDGKPLAGKGEPTAAIMDSQSVQTSLWTLRMFFCFFSIQMIWANAADWGALADGLWNTISVI